MDIAALSKALTSAVGKNDKEDEVKAWVDTGYKPLNKIISGDHDKGFPQGRIIEIYGPPAAGKTVLATLAMIAAQKAEGVAGFIDWERAWNLKFAKDFGLKDDGTFIYKRSETWEEGNTVLMQIAELVRQKRLIAPNAPIVLVADSIAAAVPQSVHETIEKKGIAGLSMNDTTALSRVASSTLKAINVIVGKYNATMIYLNQQRTKPGVVYGDPITTPGGSSFEFYATVRLALGHQKINQGTGADKEFVGRLMGITTKKNKLARPFQEVKLRLMYKDETSKATFDFERSLIDHLADDLEVMPKPKAGFVTFQGADYGRQELADKVVAAGKIAELEALLPR